VAGLKNTRGIEVLESPRGIYVLLVDVGGPVELEVGRLGKLVFEGLYAYVGSDQRGGRLARHARKGKPRKWHIDWLTGLGGLKGAWVLEDMPQTMESEIARHLARAFPAITGFGNSDCRGDPGHLFRIDNERELRDKVAEFAGSRGVSPTWWSPAVQKDKNLPC